MLSTIFSLYLAITIAMCFLRIRVGVAMFLVYSILVPFLQFFSFGQNLFYFLILISLLLKYSYRVLVFKPLKPFLFLFLAQLIIIPFHNSVPYFYQLNLFRSNFMGAMLLPFVMINVMNNDAKAVNLFIKALIFSVTIASIYSIYLTSIPGINPYLIVVLPLSGAEFDSFYALALDGGRIFGRISGVFSHPMTNGLFLSLSLIFILSRLNVNYAFESVSSIVLLLVVLVAIFVIGIRTPIVATAMGVLLYLILERRIKLAIIGAIIGGIFFLIVASVPELGEFIGSIADKDSSNVSGSSHEMRLDQLNGALDEIRGNYLFGLGYGWTDYYYQLYGGHPVMLVFESLILSVLCNNGFMGVIFWIVAMLMYYFGVRQNFSYSYANILLVLFAVYFVYSLVTGEYSYIRYFLIFYSIMWMQGKQVLKLKL